jgi:hypothetical protein
MIQDSLIQCLQQLYKAPVSWVMTILFYFMSVCVCVCVWDIEGPFALKILKIM